MPAGSRRLCSSSRRNHMAAALRMSLSASWSPPGLSSRCACSRRAFASWYCLFAAGLRLLVLPVEISEHRVEVGLWHGAQITCGHAPGEVGCPGVNLGQDAGDEVARRTVVTQAHLVHLR